MKQKQTRTVKYPEISQHAEKLGVSRGHLWHVLTGRRESRSLVNRFQKLKGVSR